ncbi:MAG: ribonuclease R [Alphaproteobacteria bacterium]|nr:ribonuclease R [Alphaproteobacteria bacterium]
MSKKDDRFPPGIPSKEMLVEFIRQFDSPPSKREIAYAFKIKGDEDRVVLKDMLRQLKKEGILGRANKSHDTAQNEIRSGKRPKLADSVRLMRVIGFNPSGKLQAKLVDSDDREPYILHYGEEVPNPHDEIMARIDTQNPENRKATLIRVLPPRMTHVLGIFHGVGEHGRIEPVNRKIQEEFAVRSGETKNAQDGELVYCELIDSNQPARRGLRLVKVLERIGRMDAPKSASLIAIQNQDIPMEFPAEAVRIAESAQPPVMQKGRVDLRDYDLVTIDGADARDFDDAVWAEPTKDGGWHVLVAIADVAHYVHFGTALDNEAFLRGNSVYFPNRVVPMLPEALSNGLCSLNPNEDRYCLAVHLWIDNKGKTTKYEFVRGLMRSKARLTYEQVQAAHDGEPGMVPEAILKNVIEPLYGVFRVLDKRRQERGALDLDLPEHKVAIDPTSGRITSISVRERFDSHKLIEECMIAANVAAANAIEKADVPGIFRVHETPDFERVMNLRTFLKQMGYSIVNKEEISPHHFNEVLTEVKDKPEAHVIHLSILRSQMAAFYHPKNLGHFGLSLDEYTHFTSPIRRYSDLIVHRTLIDVMDAVDREQDGLSAAQAENLGTISTHISQTERRAMLAEREARERYITNYMADKVGKEFDAIVASVNSFGMFAELRENGAQGLIPLRSLGSDFWLFEKELNRIVGRRTGEVFHLGQRLRVVLVEANTLTGSLQFGIVGREVAGHNPPKRRDARHSQDDRRNSRKTDFRSGNGGKKEDGGKKKPFGKGKKKPKTSQHKLENKHGKRYKKK